MKNVAPDKLDKVKAMLSAGVDELIRLINSQRILAQAENYELIVTPASFSGHFPPRARAGEWALTA